MIRHPNMMGFADGSTHPAIHPRGVRALDKNRENNPMQS